MRRFAFPLALPAALVAGLLVAACGGDSKGGAAPAGGTATAGGTGSAATAALPDTKQGLEALVGTWRAAHKVRDQAALTKLAFDIVPTTADLKSVLVAGPAADDFLGKFAAKDLKADDPMLSSLAGGLFKPTSEAQTGVSVHAATTEELVAYEKGGVADAEFPPGMKTFAALGKPKVTWYVVELLEPGKDDGMKFTCLVNVGGRFVFVAKPWRAVAGGDK